MDSILVVSGSNKSFDLLQTLLSEHQFENILTAQSSSEARRFLLENDVNLCIINTPLHDEFGTELALDISQGSSIQIILIVKAEQFEEVSSGTEESGIYTVAKPLNRQVFWSALKFAGAAHNKLMKLKTENTKLQQRLEELRIIDRAKCILIEKLKMTEIEAHRYIEKQAMDMRQSRKQIAQTILNKLN